MSPSNGVLQPVPDPRIVKREGRTPEVPAMPFRRWSSQEYPMRGLIAKEGSPEVALNQKVKNLIQKLGEAIHESVSESENIAGVVKNIREQGFDVLLMLEATIGLNEVDESEAEDAEVLEGEQEIGPFTKGDLNFLKSLRISLPEEQVEEVSTSTGLTLPAPSKASASTEDHNDADENPDPGPTRRPRPKSK